MNITQVKFKKKLKQKAVVCVYTRYQSSLSVYKDNRCLLRSSNVRLYRNDILIAIALSKVKISVKGKEKDVFLCCCCYNR